MKLSIALLLGLFLITSSCSTQTNKEAASDLNNQGIKLKDGKVLSIHGQSDTKSTVFYLVRHAEKELTGDDPGLIPEGTIRAKKIADILAEVPLSGIYATDFNRTRSTVAPTAEGKQLTINKYDHQEQAALVETLKSETGNHYLIVGHSNSIPSLLNLFQDKKVYPAIDESVYDNFYVVKVNGKGKASVTALKY